MTDWAVEYFERAYALRWALGPPSAETQREAKSLWARLGLPSGARILDVGCGHGRHAVALAQQEANVTGLDLASNLLARARRLATDLGVGVRWVRGDMRLLPFRSASFEVSMLFDAFGYFEREEENEAVLRELVRVLASGGRGALKVANAEAILAAFRATEREQRGDTAIEVSRTLQVRPVRLIEQLTITGPRGGGRYQRRQRIYRVGELTAALEAAGLAVSDVLATVTGTPFDAGSSHSMVVIGERLAGGA